MEVQAALGSDIALAFDECTPFHVERDYTARSMERTHRWLDRCVDWHARERARRPAPLRDRAGRRVRGPARRVGGRTSRARASTGSRSAARSARTRSRCARWSAGRSTACPTSRRATCSGSATSTTSSTRSAAGIDTFDCATPTRLARHGTALVHDPASRWRLDLTKSVAPREPRADRPRLPLPRLPRAHARVPALPDRDQRADRQAAAHAPQPHLHGAADEPPPRRDRRGRATPTRRRAVLSGSAPR